MWRHWRTNWRGGARALPRPPISLPPLCSPLFLLSFSVPLAVVKRAQVLAQAPALAEGTLANPPPHHHLAARPSRPSRMETRAPTQQP